MKDIFILGASGFGREIADTIHAINKAAKAKSLPAEWNVAGFIDDNSDRHGEEINGIEVVGGSSELKKLGGDHKPRVVLAISSPEIKQRLRKELSEYVLWETIIHPTVYMSEFTEIGEGTVIQQLVSIGPNTSIGDFCHVNFRSNVSHDAVLEDYVSVMCTCDLTGHVTLKKGSYAGSMVSVIPGVTVGEGAVLGAGSVVIRDVEPEAVVAGNPAKRIR